MMTVSITLIDTTILDYIHTPFKGVLVGFQLSTYTVSESDSSGLVCVNVTGESQREVVVFLSTMAGSASGQ